MQRHSFHALLFWRKLREGKLAPGAIIRNLLVCERVVVTGDRSSYSLRLVCLLLPPDNIFQNRGHGFGRLLLAGLLQVPQGFAGQRESPLGFVGNSARVRARHGSSTVI